MLIKHNYIKNWFGLILLTLLSNSVAIACSCSENELSFEERFNQADGIYFAVITSVVTVENIDKSLISGTKLEIELTVYKTYKGEEVDTLLATGFATLPFFDNQGEISISSTSCDVKYFIGKEYTLVVHDGENIDLRMCSDNIFNMRYWDKKDRDSFYKLTK